MLPRAAISIRPASEGDASRMASIHVRSKRSAYRAFMPAAYLDSLDQDGHRLERWQPYFAARAAGAVENRAWLASVGGVPAGLVALERPRAEEAVPDGYVHLHHLHAAPEFRGRGVGWALLQTAIDDARERGAPGIALWTHQPNVLSRAFYERAGWQLDGAEREEEYRWPGGAFTLVNVRYVLLLG